MEIAYAKATGIGLLYLTDGMLAKGPAGTCRPFHIKEMQATLHIEGYYQGQGGTVLPGEEDCPAYPETLSFALNGKLQSLRFGVHFCHVSADQMPDGDIRFTCSKFSEMAFAKSGFLSMDGIVSCGVKASGLNFEARDNIEVKGLKELSFLLDWPGEAPEDTPCLAFTKEGRGLRCTVSPKLLDTCKCQLI